MTTIGIAGITGQLGHLIAEELVQNHKVHLKGFGRDVNKLPEALKTKTEFITGQADDLDSLHRFIKGCDVVICCYSGDATLMINGQKRLIDLCEREGITRYIASDYTMDYRKLAMGQFPFKDAQKHIFNYLETKKHVKGVHILTNWFMDLMFSEFAPFWNASKKSFSFWGDENAVLEATTFVNTAQYVAAVALDRDAVGFKCFLGDRKSIGQIIAMMETTYKVKITKKINGTLNDLKGLVEAQNYPPILTGTYYLLTGQTRLPDNLDNSNYPEIEPVTFEKFISAASST